MRHFTIAAAAVAVLLLAGCVQDREAIQAALDRANNLLGQIEAELANARTLLDQNGASPPPPLEFPLAGFNCPDHYGEGTDCDAYQLDQFDPDNVPTYNLDALPQRGTNDEGRHQPVYHDHSQLYGIGVHDWGDNPRRIFVGTDLGDGVGRAPEVAARGATRIRHGMVADGVAADMLQAYLTESLGTAAQRWATPPTVNIAGTASAKERNWIIAAVELVNSALPVNARMRVGAASDRTVTIEYRPWREFAEGTGATTWNTLSSNEITASRIHVDRTAFAGLSHRHFVTLIAHELMHALGLGHVSPDHDTLMEETREIYRSWQGFGTRYVPDENGNPVPVTGEGGVAAGPMPMSLLYPVDREALQVLYTKLSPGADPTSYGYWSSQTLHLAGNGPHANFGVALRNGIAQPWAHGHMPELDLSANTALSGTVEWTGALLGFTPEAIAVSSDAQIAVDLATLAGATTFTGLEQWAGAPGAPGDGATWGDGDLSYAIAVAGNTFRETGGDAGRLTGVFTGARHEGAAGTLERSDLIAAFGASR